MDKRVFLKYKIKTVCGLRHYPYDYHRMHDIEENFIEFYKICTVIKGGRKHWAVYDNIVLFVGLTIVGTILYFDNQ